MACWTLSGRGLLPDHAGNARCSTPRVRRACRSNPKSQALLAAAAPALPGAVRRVMRWQRRGRLMRLIRLPGCGGDRRRSGTGWPARALVNGSRSLRRAAIERLRRLFHCPLRRRMHPRAVASGTMLMAWQLGQPGMRYVPRAKAGPHFGARRAPR